VEAPLQEGELLAEVGMLVRLVDAHEAAQDDYEVRVGIARPYLSEAGLQGEAGS
jgi:hypothetical protein